MIQTARDDFYLTDQQLEDSPSRQSGVTKEQEEEQRSFGAELIAHAGLLLKTPTVVVCTAQVLMHRYYCKKSLTKYPIKHVAQACLWLACKLEECPRRIHLFLAVFHRIDQRHRAAAAGPALGGADPPPPPLNPYFNVREYEDMKKTLVWYEMHILRCFGFVCHVDHPHKMMVSMLQLFRQGGAGGDGLMQACWNMLSDSMRTTLCVSYSTEKVACGVVFYAARRLRIPLPESPPWWEAFGVRQEEVRHVACVLYDMYNRPRPQYQDLRAVTSLRPLGGREDRGPGDRRTPEVKQGGALETPQKANGPDTSAAPTPNPPAAQPAAPAAARGAGRFVSAGPRRGTTEQQITPAATPPPALQPAQQGEPDGAAAAAAAADGAPPPAGAAAGDGPAAEAGRGVRARSRSRSRDRDRVRSRSGSRRSRSPAGRGRSPRAAHGDPRPRERERERERGDARGSDRHRHHHAHRR